MAFTLCSDRSFTLFGLISVRGKHNPANSQRWVEILEIFTPVWQSHICDQPLVFISSHLFQWCILVFGSAAVMGYCCVEGAGEASNRPPARGNLSETGSKARPFWRILSKLLRVEVGTRFLPLVYCIKGCNLNFLSLYTSSKVLR